MMSPLPKFQTPHNTFRAHILTQRLPGPICFRPNSETTDWAGPLLGPFPYSCRRIARDELLPPAPVPRSRCTYCMVVWFLPCGPGPVLLPRTTGNSEQTCRDSWSGYLGSRIRPYGDMFLRRAVAFSRHAVACAFPPDLFLSFFLPLSSQAPPSWDVFARVRCSPSSLTLYDRSLSFIASQWLL